MDFLQIKVALEIAQTRITLPLFTLDICSFAFMSFSLSLSLIPSFSQIDVLSHYLFLSLEYLQTNIIPLGLPLSHTFFFLLSLSFSLSSPLSLSHSPLSQMQVLSHSFSTSLTCINNIISFGLPLSHTFCFPPISLSLLQASARTLMTVWHTTEARDTHDSNQLMTTDDYNGITNAETWKR